MRLRRFEDHLYEQLRNEEFALEYLKAASEEGMEELLHALRDVASAQDGGIARVAREAGVGRESMYKSLSDNGNPHVRTLASILSAMGMRFCIARSDTTCTSDS